MAINLSTIPYQIEVYGKTYMVHDREVVGLYTFVGYRATGGEALIVRSLTDESETRYHKTNTTLYAADWAAKATTTPFNVI